jgi:hypothetical protein
MDTSHYKISTEEVNFKEVLIKSGFTKKKFNIRDGVLGATGTIFKNKKGCIVRIAAAVSGRDNISRILTVTIVGEGHVLKVERNPEGISKAWNILKERGHI